MVEDTRRSIIEIEYNDPLTLIYRHVKQLYMVNKLHQLNLLKLTPGMRDKVLKPILTQ